MKRIRRIIRALDPKADATMGQRERLEAFRIRRAAVLVLVLKVDLQIMPVSYGIGWLSMLVYELPLLIRYMKEDKL